MCFATNVGVLLASCMLAAACDTSSGTDIDVASDGGGMASDDAASGRASRTIPDGAELVRSELPLSAAPVSPDIVVQLGHANSQFAFELLGQLSAEKNQLYSPYELCSSIAMLYAGARAETARQIEEVLHFGDIAPELHSAIRVIDRELSSSEGADLMLQSARQAWGATELTFSPAYLDILAAQYNAGVIRQDFRDSEAARSRVNDWVSTQTSGRISSLLPQGSITPSTQVVLTSAVHLSARWLKTFAPDETREETFHSLAGDALVPMMHQEVSARYVAGSDFDAVELPYVGNAVRMIAVVPRPGEFAAVRARVSADFLSRLLASLTIYQLELALPKFNIEVGLNLSGALSSLGLTDVFGSGANFSGMTTGQRVVVNEIYHRSTISVDELGTEAAAATGVTIGISSDFPSAQLVIDRPFIFALYDQPTGQLLFLGQLVDPS